MQFDIITLFPDLIQQATQVSILGRAVEQGQVQINSHNLRDYSEDKHRRVDDTPYGGGPGMVIKPEPVVAALEAVAGATGQVHKVLLSPRGARLTQDKARDYASLDQLVVVCGRYEGIDERVLHFVDEELSIGDYVLSGGEFAALVLIDVVARLVPGVVGEPQSLAEESHAGGMLEYPQYTRPREFRGLEVPEVLQQGNHQEIESWRRKQAEALTRARRPDLVRK